jgi:pilus assembly protein CpaE
MAARVLVVDDSQVTAKVTQSYLEAAGYVVQTVADGQAALQAAEDNPPDLILLDVVLPGIDGFEVCRRLRKLPGTLSTPIIMLTSKSTIADKKVGFEAGADDYLTKPVEADELQMRAAAQLRRAARPAPEAAAPAAAGRMAAVYSLRGGAGSTTIAVNLAVMLAKLWQTPIPLLDLAMPVGVCDSMLNLRPLNRLDGLVSKALDNIDGEVVKSFLTPHSSGVHLLAGLDDPVSAELLTDRVIALLLDPLRQLHPLLVMDTAHDFSPATVAALDQAEALILAITPDLNSVRLAHAALDVFKALGYDKELLLTVNCTFSKPGLSRGQIEKALGQPINTVIPYYEGIWTQAINLGAPALLGPADNALVTVYEDLAWQVSGPVLRQSKPAQPSATWQRVTARWRGKEPGKK